MKDAKNVIDQLVNKYHSLIWTDYPIPSAHTGKDAIKAIILGADPTHIMDEKPVEINKVFEIDNEKSPYWRGINRNLQLVGGLSLDTIFVQNLCRNYFSVETSKNSHWIEIARYFWIPFLKQELDDKFSENIPILMTTEFILNASLFNGYKKDSALSIYESCKSISKDDNLFNRELIAFYRHPYYSLKAWPKYAEFISSRINK